MAEPGAPLEPALFPLVLQLTNPDQREAALLELSKKREAFSDLVSALLQEIISIYPMLSPPTLTAHASNRVCNALALLQCVASHQETRGLFLSAHIPLYLYPFLNTVSKNRPFEYLRLTSLGVIGALVKVRLPLRPPPPPPPTIARKEPSPPTDPSHPHPTPFDVSRWTTRRSSTFSCKRRLSPSVSGSWRQGASYRRRCVRVALEPNPHTMPLRHRQRPCQHQHHIRTRTPGAGRHVHCAEDPARRDGPQLHLRDGGAVLCGQYGAVQHGGGSRGAALGATAQAHCPVLPAALGQPAGSGGA
mmetsp:Transcript_37754/g.102920  ORF Transcript_37754/g.102920 Transcript_37754/m.102920 type:complete len:303 (+) Transcript_37754:367-1275(+)